MELWQIRYFLTVAEYRSISKAAEKLNMSQPPLSRQIRAMEKDVGVPLFNRKKTGLELTPAGVYLEKRGKELLRCYENMMDGLARVSSREKNQIVFGSNDGGTKIVLPECSRLFNQNFEYAEVISYVFSTEEIFEQLANGNIDIGIVRTPFPDMQDYDVIQFSRESWIALTAHDYAGAADWKDSVGITEITNHPLIMPSRRTLYLPIRNALKWDDIEPQILSYYFELANGVALAQHRLGVAIAPECISRIVPPEEYRTFRIEGLTVKTGYALLRQKNREYDETARRFWNILERVYGSRESASDGEENISADKGGV